MGLKFNALFTYAFSSRIIAIYRISYNGYGRTYHWRRSPIGSFNLIRDTSHHLSGARRSSATNSNRVLQKKKNHVEIIFNCLNRLNEFRELL